MKRAKEPDERRNVRQRFVLPFEPLLKRVDEAREQGVYPFYWAVLTANGREPERRVVLTANDYLGLTKDPRVREAAQAAIARYGTSLCASPLAGGYTELHRELERRLARFLEQEDAALFATGYQANVGIVSALVGRGDLVLADVFDHASIVDGARLSGAEVRFFRHNSVRHLGSLLQKHSAGRRTLVIVEGVYSADGDVAPLPEICATAHEHGAVVMVDEAHSLGVLGPRGAGAAEHFGLLGDVDLVMGTLSKSLASVGGFVAGDRSLVDVIRHHARSLIFSAVLPPANVAAALASLDILEREKEQRWRLWNNARTFLTGLRRLGLDTMHSVTPVIPVLVGSESRAVEVTAALREKGVLVCPAIPPMVQAHLSRVRAHVTAAHDAAELGYALDAFGEVASRYGLPRRERADEDVLEPEGLASQAP